MAEDAKRVEADEIVDDIETSLRTKPDPGHLTTVYANGVVEVATGEIARMRASANRFGSPGSHTASNGSTCYSCCCSCG